jgi:hypothetical protein
MNAMGRKDRVLTAQVNLQETDVLAIANPRLLAIDGNNQRSIND